jgi:two-component system response regulator AtoC
VSNVTVDADTIAAPLSASSVLVELGERRREVDVAHSGELTVGRADDATLSIDDERVSRRHFSIAWRDGALSVRDLGSRNGTFVNGRRVDAERRLRAGDIVTAGPVRVLVGGTPPPEHLLDEGALVDRLDEELERARLFRRPFGVIGVVLEGTPEAVTGAIQRLASRRGRADTLGEYAAGRLLGLLPERDLAAAEALARDWASTAAEVDGVSARAAAAAFPHSGADADALVAQVFGDARATPAAEGQQRVVAEDPKMRELFELVRRVARATTTLLVVGESGVGKEVVAAELHAASPRAQGPFVELNCAALPGDLIESELFGHERGAFTGADRKRVGMVEAADGGTLFLDEIGELPLPLQAKLLRVLENKTVQPLGASEGRRIDVRFVAATNRKLDEEVRAGRFREDLYFRLSTIVLEVPPLRERPGDLRALARQFVAAFSAAAGRSPPVMSEGFLAQLASYPWPGNVRELRNAIERAVVLGKGGELLPKHLPERLREVDPPSSADGPMRKQLDDVEKKSIEAALQETHGNRTHAARKLGISRRTLIYKLHKYGLIRTTTE